MSYNRKQEDKKRLKKMIEDGAGWWPCGAYESQKPNKPKYFKRYWKSRGKNSAWAWHKKQSHRTYRRFVKQNDFYSKKAYDLWWNVW